MKRVIFSRSVCMLLICSMLSMLTMTGCIVKPKLELAEDGTSISPAMYDDATFIRLLEKYYPAFEFGIDTTEKSTFAIPGLDATTTLPLEDSSTENGEDKDSEGETTEDYKPEIEICDQMTPQGITVTDTYMFSTAYCAKHEHNSVMYMMDKETGEYLKTIVLRGKTHAGGIAYVESANGIWVTTNQGSIKGQGELSLISMDAIENYDLATSRAPIEYAAVQSLAETSVASSLAYYDDYLMVGHFDETEKGTVVCYKLDANGMPQMQTATTTMEIDNEELAEKALRETAETTSAQEALAQIEEVEEAAKEEAEEEAALEAAATAKAATTEAAETSASAAEAASEGTASADESTGENSTASAGAVEAASGDSNASADAATTATTGATLPENITAATTEAAEGSLFDGAATAAEEFFNKLTGGSTDGSGNNLLPTTEEAEAAIEEKLENIVSTGGLYLEQGIGADDEFVYLTESYGVDNSHFIVLEPDTSQGIAGWVDFDNLDFTALYMDMPRYVEQVTCDGDYIYFIFEGAANKYRDRDVSIHVDRIVRVDKDLIIGSLELIDEIFTDEDIYSFD